MYKFAMSINSQPCQKTNVMSLSRILIQDSKTASSSIRRNAPAL